MLKFFYTTQTGWDGREVKYAVGYERLDRHKMRVSFARCSANDTFSKEKARLMCKGRMEKGKYEEVVQGTGMDKYKTLLNAIEAHEIKVKENYSLK